MVDETNITLISNKQFSEMKASVAAMKTQKELLIEYQQLVAPILKAKYDALIEQGFEKEEAINLCRTIY